MIDLALICLVWILWLICTGAGFVMIFQGSVGSSNILMMKIGCADITVCFVALLIAAACEVPGV